MIPSDKLLSLGIRPIYERYCPLGPEDLALLTEALGKPLPPDYLELVSAFGCAFFPGHRVVVNCINQPPPEVSDTGFLLVSSLLGGGTQKHRVVQQLQLTRGELPSDLIPIASDYFGNLFCLSIGGEFAGKVFFWDASREPTSEEDGEQGLPGPTKLSHHDLTLVAASLHDFINRLEILPTE